MTVVTAIYFNERDGAMIADEQSNSAGRKEYDADKCKWLTIPDYDHAPDEKEIPINILIGGTGTSDILNAVKIRTTVDIANNQRAYKTKEDVARLIGEKMIEVRRDFTDAVLRTNYGIGEAEFQTGTRLMPDGSTRPLHPRFMREYEQTAQRGRGPLGYVLNNEFLVLGSDRRGIQIYRVMMNAPTPIPVARPYQPVGLGVDMAEPELAGFFERLSREKRKNVGKIRGLIELLNATEKANLRNLGVGGNPMIGIIEDGKIIVPKENNAHLALDLVFGLKRGRLPQDFVEDAIERVIYREADFRQVFKEMFDAADNRDRLLEELLDYKED